MATLVGGRYNDPILKFAAEILKGFIMPIYYI